MPVSNLLVRCWVTLHVGKAPCSLNLGLRRWITVQICKGSLLAFASSLVCRRPGQRRGATHPPRPFGDFHKLACRALAAGVGQAERQRRPAKPAAVQHGDRTRSGRSGNGIPRIPASPAAMHAAGHAVSGEDRGAAVRSRRDTERRNLVRQHAYRILAAHRHEVRSIQYIGRFSGFRFEPRLVGVCWLLSDPACGGVGLRVGLRAAVQRRLWHVPEPTARIRQMNPSHRFEQRRHLNCEHFQLGILTPIWSFSRRIA